MSRPIEKTWQAELAAVKAEEASAGLTTYYEELFQNNVRLIFRDSSGNLLGVGNAKRNNKDESFKVDYLTTIDKKFLGIVVGKYPKRDMKNAATVEIRHRREDYTMAILKPSDLNWEFYP